MGAKTEPNSTDPPESSESEETSPRPVSLRPRGVGDFPDVPEAKASEDSIKDRPPIPLKPRKVEPSLPVVEIDNDPPVSVDRDLDADPPEAPSLDGEPVPAEEDGREDSPSAILRPRGVDDHDISTIKERAAANTVDGPALPDDAPAVPLKPRPKKLDPSAEVEIIEDVEVEEDDRGDDDEDHLRLQDRKTGVTRLLSNEDFEQEAAKLQKKNSQHGSATPPRSKRSTLKTRA